MADVSAITAAIEAACPVMQAWLQTVPEWGAHPTNASRTVSANFGPTILSEHDCVMHFARFLCASGVAWEDLHLELSPGQWMYLTEPGAPFPKRIDLAVVGRDHLQAAGLPVALGKAPLDAACEFALAGNYWMHGVGSPSTARDKVAADVVKVGHYLETGLAWLGYVIVVEECDHGFEPTFAESALSDHGVRVRFLRLWS